MKSVTQKIAQDLYFIQLKWTAWYLPIVYIVYFLLLKFVAEPELRGISLLTFTFQTATIFMLVCGIIVHLIFLSVFISHGLTRKSFFKGALIASFGIGLTVIITTILATWLIGFFNLDMLEAVVLSPLGDGTWLATSTAYFISIMIYCFIGWLIGATFYRYGASKGILSIVFSIILIMVNDVLWPFNTPKPFMGLLNISFTTPAIVISSFLSLCLATIAIIAVHRIVKETPIKI